MPKSFLFTYWKSILLCIVIFILSTVTFNTIPDVAKFQNSDKITHVLMYAGLCFVAYFEYLKDTFFKLKYRHLFTYMFLFFVIFGGVIEVLQGTLFKPRTSEFVDWIADIAGLIIGVVAGMVFFGKSKKTKM